MIARTAWPLRMTRISSSWSYAMMIARRSAIFSFEKPPTSGSRKLKNA